MKTSFPQNSLIAFCKQILKPTSLMVLHTRWKATPARILLQFKVHTFLLRKCAVFFFQYTGIPDHVKATFILLFHFWPPLSADTKMFFSILDPFALSFVMLKMIKTGKETCSTTTGPGYTTCSPFLPEAAWGPWATSRETEDNVFWQTVLAKSGVFCHRRGNHSHIYKNIGMANRS